MTTNVNALSNEAWSSQKDQIYLKDATPYEIKCYHNRYFLAWEKCVKPVYHSWTGKFRTFNVLDAATGSGAGAAYLCEQLINDSSRTPFAVVGVDLSAEAIKAAETLYSKKSSRNTLIYRCEDICKMVDTSENWDVIVSMETLEHIPHDIMITFLTNCSKSLMPGGKAIFSCPRLRPRESTVKRPGHINELSYQDFKYTLGEYFQFLEFYSFDRYGNVVPDYPDCNLQVAICSKPPTTKIF